MISVNKHARGIAIAAPEGADRSPRLVRLGLRLAGDAYVSGGRLIALSESASAVLSELGTEGVEWDADLLRRAERQSKRRDLQLRARLEVAKAIEDPRATLGTYSRLHLLDEHQIEAVAALTAPSLQGIALFDEQGTGKTIITLAAFDVLRAAGRVEKMLVVAPKSVLGSWREQSAAFLRDEVRVSLVDGSSRLRRRSILKTHDILLIGYEGLVREEALLRTIIGARPSTYFLAVDESYFVKNAATVRAGAVGRLRDLCERAVVLCGTPAPNSPTDVINQINLADLGVAFGTRGSAISEDRTTIETALQDAVVLRRLKEQVLPDIPAKQFERVHLDLSPHQRGMYDRACANLAIEVRSVDDRQFRRQLASFLARRTRLLQICSNPSGIDPLYDEEPAKLRALDRLLSELVEGQHQKVVIWSYFRASLEAIAQRYARYGLVRIDGSVSSVEVRIEAVARFQTDPSTRIFLGNAAAAGAGITLTAAHHAIYESFSNQAAHYMQSVDRIHRRGQRESVVSHVLIARHTIEDSEYARLVQKERAGRHLLGDRYDEPLSRDRFLAELETSV